MKRAYIFKQAYHLSILFCSFYEMYHSVLYYISHLSTPSNEEHHDQPAIEHPRHRIKIRKRQICVALNANPTLNPHRVMSYHISHAIRKTKHPNEYNISTHFSLQKPFQRTPIHIKRNQHTSDPSRAEQAKQQKDRSAMNRLCITTSSSPSPSPSPSSSTPQTPTP